MPRQLPAVTRRFIGRERRLAELDGLVEANRGAGDSAAVAVVTGAPGIGKTALVVHWAHRIADRFPDGQLFLNLCGFGPSAEPLPAGRALCALLGALGVEPDRIPADTEAQAALYRSLLADKRMLVVLDNARAAEQVRPLLPGCPTCLVVVTSRNRLAGLIATEGARPVPLDLFTEAEARDLLADRIGTRRTAAEPQAVDEIVARCAGLPLALAVSAAHAAVRPASGLAALAGRRGRAHRLDALAEGDPASDLRAVFSWSTRALGPAAARLFRLLGMHPGPHFTLGAAAGLAGLSHGRTERLLAELADACLISEPAPGRYHIHSLLHAYAAEAMDLDGDGERYSAMRRMFDHYLYARHATALAAVPAGQRGSPGATAAAERSHAARIVLVQPGRQVDLGTGGPPDLLVLGLDPAQIGPRRSRPDPDPPGRRLQSQP